MSSGSIPYLGADTDYHAPNTIYYNYEAHNPTDYTGKPGEIDNYTGLLNSALKNNTLNSGGVAGNAVLITNQPWGIYPEGHEPFDELQVGTVPDVGAAAVTLFTYLVPNGYDAVVQRYSINFAGGGLDGYNFGDLVWRVYANGKLVRNFDNIQSERGTYQVPREISNLRFHGGDLIVVTVSHPQNDAISGNSTVSMSGYIYPTTTMIL